MWEKFKEILGDLVLIGCGVAFLYIFISIIVTGGYIAVEERIIVNWCEIIMAAVILIVGIDRFIGDVKK